MFEQLPHRAVLDGQRRQLEVRVVEQHLEVGAVLVVGFPLVQALGEDLQLGERQLQLQPVVVLVRGVLEQILRRKRRSCFREKKNKFSVAKYLNFNGNSRKGPRQSSYDLYYKHV